MTFIGGLLDQSFNGGGSGAIARRALPPPHRRLEPAPGTMNARADGPERVEGSPRGHPIGWEKRSPSRANEPTDGRSRGWNGHEDHPP
jgi:hypothetical protein